MSVIRKVMETMVRYLPAKAPDPLATHRGHIGREVDRVDGALKVTGSASFTADMDIADLTHAALVHATIAKGRIVCIDSTKALAATGVIAVITHENAPKMKPPQLLSLMMPGRGSGGSDLPILQTPEVHYDGEPVAIIVAETLDQAEHAATLVEIEYAPEATQVAFDAAMNEAIVPKEVLGEDAELIKGDVDAALSGATQVVDRMYRTPRYNHNAIELHSTIATWDGDDRLTVYDATQSVNGFKHQLAHIFGLGKDDVRVISAFVGGGFGGKWCIWPNSALCAAAAKVVNRPVRLWLTREGVFRIIGGRTLSEQQWPSARTPRVDSPPCSTAASPPRPPTPNTPSSSP